MKAMEGDEEFKEEVKEMLKGLFFFSTVKSITLNPMWFRIRGIEVVGQ